MRDWMIVVAACLVAVGFSLLSIPVGLIVAGSLLGAIAFLSE